MPKQDETTGFRAAGGQSRLWANAEKPYAMKRTASKLSHPSTVTCQEGSFCASFSFTLSPDPQNFSIRLRQVLRISRTGLAKGLSYSWTKTTMTMIQSNRACHQLLKNHVDPFDAVQKEEQWMSKNAERCKIRRRLARENPEAAAAQRKEAGEERAALVLQVWSEQYEEGATRQVAVTQATAENKPILRFIQDRVAVYMAANHHVPISETDPVWQSFSPHDIALLAAFAHQPTAWDAEPFLADGTIIRSLPGSPAPIDSVHTYIRRLCTRKPRKALQKYLFAHPANAASTLLQLVLQGTDLEALEENFADAMEEYSLAEPARTFVQHVRAHHSTQSLSGTRYGKKLPYTGITQKVACDERAENDLKNGAAVMIVNFLSANKDMEVETFHIPGLDMPTSDKYNIRTNTIPSQKEHIVRALLAASAMNSAEGGVLPIFLPTPAELAIRDNTLPSEDLDPLPLGEDCDPELENIIHKTLEDELRIFRTLGSQISPVAIKAVFNKLSHVVRRKLDRVVKMDVTQDIPREAFLGKVGGYWDSITGRGPQEERHLRRLSSSSIPAVGDIEIDILVKFIGPFVDFWRLDLFHSRYYWLHTLFMSRLLDRIHPFL
ncbi:hypothetical protein B0H13DRAFT_2345297 [Mycena leptocephala]|nr:hypothetical protein B0H13DRAFT_2345297 [Mycena leptocephala]